MCLRPARTAPLFEPGCKIQSLQQLFREAPQKDARLDAGCDLALTDPTDNVPGLAFVSERVSVAIVRVVAQRPSNPAERAYLLFRERAKNAFAFFLVGPVPPYEIGCEKRVLCSRV